MGEKSVTAGKAASKPLNNVELAGFCGQMALILKSGISAAEGLLILQDDAPDETSRAIYAKLSATYLETGSLVRALSEQGIFPNYMITMVKIGEETGNLDVVMNSLETHYEREEAIRRDSQSAVIYPLIISGMMLAVIIVLMVRVLPVFNQVFLDLGTEMTGFPAVMLRFGDAIRQYSLSFLLILFSILLICFVLNRTPDGRKVWHKFLSRFKSFRAENEAIAANRFAATMSMVLASGLTPEQGMDLAIELSDDDTFSAKLRQTKADMETGSDFAEALHKNHVFSGMYSRMLAIGTKTGSTDQVLAKIAELYQEESSTRLNNRLSSIEPVLVIVLSAVVGIVLLSVMFPLLGIVSSL